ncbi:hypothetical protein RDWZM_010186 [Blomia tropicalis]|uniref:Chitin-binding type-2 domain-containing protein n=1 Tax=Blomia tropicalis TaxID=40697 RepID=A0A9Q0LYT8_BLOTA|nr:hypothetical protein RDWZM_010186 [Blomia tropicalis]
MLDNIPNQIGWNKFCILLYTIVLLVHVITIVECVDDDNDETSIVDPESNLELPPIHLIRSRREVIRGQNYHYQREYELNRLRFEQRHPDRPKAFFVREYHQGHDVPKPLLQLTELKSLSNPTLVQSIVVPTTASSLIEADVRVRPDSMKPMQSDDNNRQQWYATKAALKAALEHGDKDLSILEYLKAKQEHAKAKAKAKEASGESSPSSPSSSGDGGDSTDGGSDEQTKEDGPKTSGGDSINKNVRFDEQTKEDIDKILAYDPRKPFGDRLRPGSGGIGGSILDTRYPTSRRPTFPDFIRTPSGSGGGVGGGGARYPTGASMDGQLTKLRRLYPHLFPESDIDQGGSRRQKPASGSAGAGGIGGGTSGPGANAGAGIGSGGGGSGGAGDGQGSADLGGPGGFSGPGVAARPSIGSTGGIGGGGLGGVNRTLIPTGSGFVSPYPSRFPGTRLSGLTQWPNVRNSTYPGIPGYIRYDYPGYSTIPYTGFKCEHMPYKYGYYADISAGCQVFHVCQKDGRMDSFLCPNGTLFHQKVMTCDWWYHVHCPSSSGYYYLNGRIGVLPFLPATLARFD